MLNLLAIRCGLCFAPYLTDAVTGYLNDGRFNSRVVKQGGNGLIMRSDTEVALRFQTHEAALGHREARHYAATIAFRSAVYDIARMTDEIVMATVGDTLLLSHPQSELWLEADTVAALLRTYEQGAKATVRDAALPEWLNVSTGAGRLLLSDQRTGRWVLLGAEHVAEARRRLQQLAPASGAVSRLRPPTWTIKGVTVHLQSAFKLAAALEGYAESGKVMAFTEQSPGFELAVEQTKEGMALRDFDQRATLTAREARKYALILRDELERRRAVEFERGRLRTVFADDEGGRWVLQWGDEILLTGEAQSSLRVTRADEFLLLLDPASGACVALTDTEAAQLSAAS
ncbi:MAG TPA: hypothetical protein VKA60_20380 [Blastocatellia bacterium]|nr:hypothetical protein [Blastocatellia bacterium]